MTSASTLSISLVRRPDGAIVFELRRPDGSTTWHKRVGATAEFFAVHDITHYAVESALGLREAFYGLIAGGWNLTDFGHSWPRGPLPMEAIAAEVVVGCFDRQRAAHEPLTAAECNASLEGYFGAKGVPVPLRVTDAQLDRARQLISDLAWRWHSAGVREPLVLAFP